MKIRGILTLNDIAQNLSRFVAHYNQAQLPVTLPSASNANFSKTVMLKSKSSALHPTHLSTTVTSTVLFPLPDAFCRVILIFLPQRGLALGFELVEAASKMMWDTAQMDSDDEDVIPHAPRPGA